MTINPFRPTFGASPRIWAGRRAALDQFRDAISGGPGHPDRSMLISGARGIGKTVLLTELEDIAAGAGWLVVRVPSSAGMPQRLVESIIPEALQKFRGRMSETRLTSLRLSMLGGVSTETTQEDKPVPTLSSVLRQLAEALSAHDTGFLISIDEVQDSLPEDLNEIAVAYQDLVRDDFHVAIIMAGLSHGIDKLLNLPGTTFLRRARHFELGALTHADSLDVLRNTAADSGKTLTHDAAELAALVAQGYPYLVQLVGALAWDSAKDSITVNHVQQVQPVAIETLGWQVHSPSVKGLPDRQLEFLHAMAKLVDEEGTVAIAALAELLGVPTTSLSDTRAKLISQGLIESAGWGKLRYVLPYFKEFLEGTGQPQKLH